MSGMGRGSEVEPAEQLERDWLRAEGAAVPRCLEVHPGDEMFWQPIPPDQPHRRRLDYLRSAFESLAVLENVLAAAGRSLQQCGSVLDFACGYGRLVRLLVERLPRERIWASDIVRTAVDFVRTRMGVETFLSAAAVEAVAWPRRFDLIHVGSLFSHLPARSFGPFLHALVQQLTDDGLLVFSTHSPEVLSFAADASGFTFRPESESRLLPASDYGAAWVEPARVRSICAAAGIVHLGCLERELWRIQDVHVVARRHHNLPSRLRPAAVARGSILRAEIGGDGQAFVGGYFRVPTTGPGVRAVHLCVDGEREEVATCRAHLQPLPPSEGGDRFRQWEWVVAGPAPELRRGRHTVCASVTFADGRRSCFDGRFLEPTP